MSSHYIKAFGNGGDSVSITPEVIAELVPAAKTQLGQHPEKIINY